MKSKFFLFLMVSFLAFGSSEEALKNALDRFYSNTNATNMDIRTAKALFQPDEKTVTIPYKNEEKSGYTFTLEPNGEYTCKVTLFKGFQYIIVGAGDNNALDVDIFIYDLNENTVAFDRTSDITAYALLPKDFALSKDVQIDTSIVGTDISIKPLETEKYIVKIKLRASKAPSSDVAFIVAAKKLK